MSNVSHFTICRRRFGQRIAYTDGSKKSKIFVAMFFPYMDIENKTMSRKHHELIAGYCYHITVRCNNREFRLTRLECRKVLQFSNECVLI
ncbi:MAG: hypothetical protein ACKPCM_06880 [Pseudanabaena sp.]